MFPQTADKLKFVRVLDYIPCRLQNVLYHVHIHDYYRTFMSGVLTASLSLFSVWAAIHRCQNSRLLD